MHEMPGHEDLRDTQTTLPFTEGQGLPSTEKVVWQAGRCPARSRTVYFEASTAEEAISLSEGQRLAHPAQNAHGPYASALCC